MGLKQDVINEKLIEALRDGYDRGLLGIPLYVEETQMTHEERVEAARKRQGIHPKTLIPNVPDSKRDDPEAYIA